MEHATVKKDIPKLNNLLKCRCEIGEIKRQRLNHIYSICDICSEKIHINKLFRSKLKIKLTNIN